MAHAHKGKKKVSKAMGEILKAPKKAEKVVKAAKKYVNKVHWNTIEEMATALNHSGLTPEQINVHQEWEAYQSNKDDYRNVQNLKSIEQINKES